MALYSSLSDPTLAIPLGVVAGALFIALARRHSSRGESKLHTRGLSLAAVIYRAFGPAPGAPIGRLAVIAGTIPRRGDQYP